jgi:general secretion pathway protein A
MYEKFYALRERPFDLTPNPKYLYLTARHREALSSLQYGITGRRGVTLLIGEAGTGKTTIVKAALDAVAGPSTHVVYLSNPVLTRTEFFEFLAARFGFHTESGQSKARFLLDLERTVTARHEAGGLTALVIDEAQSLPHELLEEIRLLANIETETDKLLPVVLAGQPELAERLEHEDLRQLKQRVALRCDLQALDIRETAAYIAGRIAIAGGDSARIFTREAVLAIFERSRGIPRTISVICDNVLISGFAAGIKPVGSNVVVEVCRDFRLPPVKSGLLGGSFDGTRSEGAIAKAPQGSPVEVARTVRLVRPPASAGSQVRDGSGSSRRDDDEMFSSYTKKKRFSFF